MATFLLRILTFITFLSNVVSALEPSGEDLREGEDQNAWGRGRHLRIAKENEDLMTEDLFHFNRLLEATSLPL